jgi:hypothetical protein
MFRSLRWTLLLALAAVPLAAGAQAYRWVDEKGQVHYSQTPPPGKKAEAVAPPPPVSGAPNQDALNRSLDQERATEPERRKAAENAAAQQQQIQQQCNQAREQLAFMEAKTARRLGTTDDQGNVSRVTEEEFQARRAELQRVIAERCN